MGRRRTSESDREFRREVARRFRTAMRARGLNQTQAADELRITKQALSQYLCEKSTPQGEILARACAKWGVRLRYRDAEFTRGAFGADRSVGVSESVQLDLFREPQIFENPSMVVTLARSRKATLQVTIKMKRASAPPRTESLRKSS